MARTVHGGLVFIGIVFSFVGGIFLFIAGNEWLTEQRYQDESVAADAVVTGKTLRRATEKTGTVYELAYEVPQPDGTRHQQTEAVSAEVWERVSEGERVRVQFIGGPAPVARVEPDAAGVSTVALIFLPLGAVMTLFGLGFIVRGIIGTTEDGEQPAAPPSAPTARRIDPDTPLWRLAGRSFGVWFGGLFLLVGVVLGSLAAYRTYEHRSFTRDAQQAQGLVLTKEIRQSGSRSRGQTTHYEVTYRFSAGGQTYTGRDELAYDAWLRLSEREPATVLYDPRAPGSSRLSGDRPWTPTIVMILGSLIFSTVGGVFFFPAWRALKLEQRLRRQGRRTDGTVVDLQPRNVRINNVQQWRLRYEYRDDRGQRHEGRFDLPAPDAAAWQPGARGIVLFDPERSRDSVWLGAGDAF